MIKSLIFQTSLSDLDFPKNSTAGISQQNKINYEMEAEQRLEVKSILLVE